MIVPRTGAPIGCAAGVRQHRPGHDPSRLGPVAPAAGGGPVVVEAATPLVGGVGDTDQSDVVEPLGMVRSEVLTDGSAGGQTDNDVHLPVELGDDQVGVVGSHVLDRVPWRMPRRRATIHRV